MAKVKILVVDDEPAIRTLLRRRLADYDYHILTASSGQEVPDLVERQTPDLILLDVSLDAPSDGLEVCRALREWSRTPIIMLTVRDDKATKLAALNAGADDYMTKPFDMDELEARIRAVLRRSAYEGSKSASGEIHVDDLTINLLNRRVTLKGQEVHLTPREYSLLKLLATHPGKVLTFGTLLKEVWGQNYDRRAGQNVRVYINTLRKKLHDDLAAAAKPRFIFNEPGVGYRFTDIQVTTPQG